jgi:hypothetical protein
MDIHSTPLPLRPAPRRFPRLQWPGGVLELRGGLSTFVPGDHARRDVRARSVCRLPEVGSWYLPQVRQHVDPRGQPIDHVLTVWARICDEQHSHRLGSLARQPSTRVVRIKRQARTRVGENIRHLLDDASTPLVPVHPLCRCRFSSQLHAPSIEITPLKHHRNQHRHDRAKHRRECGHPISAPQHGLEPTGKVQPPAGNDNPQAHLRSLSAPRVTAQMYPC